MASDRAPAVCRWCRQTLRGDAYMYGGRAYHPRTGEQCKVNHYGGFVCSRACDWKASVEMLSSMPGCFGATKPSIYAAETIKRNWPDDN